MKWIITLMVVLVLGAGAYYFLNGQNSQPQLQGPSGPTPSTAMGLNGSPNQGNLGQPDNGTVQQPGADGAEGSVIGSNLALGIDKTGSAHLVGYTGMTVYTYDKDTAISSTCYDACAANWPPYVVGPEDNLTQLMAGVTGKVDTTKRTDGSLQVTYNGHPLYFFAADKSGNDMTGDGKGGVWHIVKP
jgi:predicted lipoprotein with Yx(FWY)xxD motif